MQLSRYLRRIGYDGAVAADLATFSAIHRAHALSLAYENLDVQFKRPVTREPSAAFDKIVTHRRGGWCYEMNGLLGWALEEIGFDVTRLAGAVMRDAAGDGVIGNHLVLLVRIEDEEFIGDVGFGDGLIDPVPLREGPTAGNPLRCQLRSVGGGWWRYVNDPRSGGPTFDFNRVVTDETLLEQRCRYLQSDPASPFVQNAVVQRWTEDAHLSLRGRILRTLTPHHETKTLISDAEDYVAALKNTFGLDLPEASSLWPKIRARHEEVFAGKDPLASEPHRAPGLSPNG